MDIMQEELINEHNKIKSDFHLKHNDAYCVTEE